MAEAATILRAAGHHAAPIPLAETMLARWLCAACGVEAPAGALTIGPVEPEDRLDIAEAAVSGHAGYIPWGREAAAVVLIAGNTLLAVPQGAANFTPGKNLAGEPRDHLSLHCLTRRKRQPAPTLFGRRLLPDDGHPAAGAENCCDYGTPAFCSPLYSAWILACITASVCGSSFSYRSRMRCTEYPLNPPL